MCQITSSSSPLLDGLHCIRLEGYEQTSARLIPAYNEEENIVSTIEDLRKNAPDIDYVIVNDGSKDGTAAICRERGYHLISLPVNLGLAGAFQTGMKYAYANGYDYAIQFDADASTRRPTCGPW